MKKCNNCEEKDKEIINLRYREAELEINFNKWIKATVVWSIIWSIIGVCIVIFK